MDCDLTRPELIAFYLSEIDNEVRERVEAHLLSCPECLRKFFVLKRTIEVNEAKPSEDAKARLRDAVAQEVVARKPAAWSWWQRPLAVAVAAAAVVLALSAVNVLVASSSRTPNARTTERLGN